MPKPTVDSIPAVRAAKIAAYRESIAKIERLRDSLRDLDFGVFGIDKQADTTQLQKQHISGALAHLEGWLVIQRFRLIDLEHQAHRPAVKEGATLGLSVARDVMRPPQEPYTHIGVDPGSAEGDRAVMHPYPSCQPPS